MNKLLSYNSLFFFFSLAVGIMGFCLSYIFLYFMPKGVVLIIASVFMGGAFFLAPFLVPKRTVQKTIKGAYGSAVFAYWLIIAVIVCVYLWANYLFVDTCPNCGEADDICAFEISHCSVSGGTYEKRICQNCGHEFSVLIATSNSEPSII